MEKFSSEYILNYITAEAEISVVQINRSSGIVKVFGEEVSSSEIISYLATKSQNRRSRVQMYGKMFDIWSTEEGTDLLCVMKKVDDTTELEKTILDNSYMKDIELIFKELLHEIRTPLGTMKNYLHIVTEEMKRYGGGRRKNDVALESLRAIHEEILRIDSMLNAFYDMWSEEGEEISSSDLGSETRFMEKIYRKVFDVKGIAFSVEGPEEGVVIAFPTRAIRQVMANLINNAYEAAREGGAVWVKTFEQGKKGILEVGDDGGGIDDGLIPSLFKKPLLSDKGKGRGYGLWITGKLVHKYDGSIQYKKSDSESVFRIEFNKKAG